MKNKNFYSIYTIRKFNTSSLNSSSLNLSPVVTHFTHMEDIYNYLVSNPTFLSGFTSGTKKVFSSSAMVVSKHTKLTNIRNFSTNTIIKIDIKENSNTKIKNYVKPFTLLRIPEYPILKIEKFGINLNSTVGYGKYPKIIQNNVRINKYHMDVIVGILLSDGWLHLPNKYTKNCFLGLEQSLDKSDYLLFVFFELSHFCSTYPVLRIKKRLNITTYSLYFNTRILPCFTDLSKEFYVNNNKIIPLNIFELLTPVSTLR